MTRYCDDVALHGDMEHAELLLEPPNDSSEVLVALFSKDDLLLEIAEVEKRKHTLSTHAEYSGMTSGMMLNWDTIASASGMALQRYGSAWFPAMQSPSGRIPPPPPPTQAPGFTMVTR